MWPHIYGGIVLFFVAITMLVLVTMEDAVPHHLKKMHARLDNIKRLQELNEQDSEH